MNIFEKFKDYSIDIISVFIVIGALIFAFYRIYYNPLLQYNKTIKIISNKYQKEEISLHKQLKLASEDKKKDDATLNTIPKLLTRINNTCKAPKVIIRTLTPNSKNPFAFELKFISNYFDFLYVLSEFEKLDIVINKIDIKPYEIKGNNSKHIVTLNIEAINGGERLSLKDVNFLKQELNKKGKRDPFQKFAKIGKTIKRLVDLTWMYQLSGIGKVNGKYVVTIDHRIYYEKSKFNGMKITKITSKGLYLKKNTTNGVAHYVLNFRSKVNKGK